MKMTDLETKIMTAIWKLGGKATVNEILKVWEYKKVPKYTTILKTIQIMEDKELLSHKKSGRAYKYISKINREKSGKAGLKDLIKNFFNDNNLALANTLISKNEFSLKELRELKKMIVQKEKEMKNE